jgi:alpha-ketoglutarate-dependent taurine dioxygenase
MSDESFARMAEVFYERSVLCIRDQQLEPQHLLDFAGRFGALDVHFLDHYTVPGYPNILQISNIQKDGKDIGFADAGRVWHSDGSYMQTPVAVSMLYALEVPEENGRALGSTQFASAWAAYDDLDDELKAKMSTLKAVHQVAGRRKNTGTGRKDREQEKAQPEAIHPLARTHPRTGRNYIFVSKGECEQVIGMDEAEGLELIDHLATQMHQPKYQHRHDWRVGDLLVWDNQAVQHLATFDYEWPRHRRLMHRLTITEGTEPQIGPGV